MNDQEFTVRADEEVRSCASPLAGTACVVARVVLDGSSAASRPEAGQCSRRSRLRWVTEPGKPVPGATRGSGSADAAQRVDVPVRGRSIQRRSGSGSRPQGCSDETFLTIGSGETKTIELRPRADRRREARDFPQGDRTGRHRGRRRHAAAGITSRTGRRAPGGGDSRDRPPPGPFRWRVRVLPIDLPAAAPAEDRRGRGEDRGRKDDGDQGPWSRVIRAPGPERRR